MMAHHTIDLGKRKELLLKQACFAQFKPDEIDVLASLLIEKHFSPEEVIVNEGDPVDSVYLIVKGTTDVRHIKIEDSETVTESVATLKAGDAIGLNETGFYSLSGIRTATVVAASDVIALQLSVAQFHGFSLAYSHVSEVMREQARNFLNPK